MNCFVFLIVTFGFCILFLETSSLRQNTSELVKSNGTNKKNETLPESLSAIHDVNKEHYSSGYSSVRKQRQSSNSLDDVSATDEPITSATDFDFSLLNGVMGKPGRDFPVLTAVPRTKFNCRNLKSGYYADVDTACQVFHICDNGRKISFLCPNGTIFHQADQICDWWFRVDCTKSLNYYDSSAKKYEQASKPQYHVFSTIEPKVENTGDNSINNENLELVKFAASSNFGDSRNLNSVENYEKERNRQLSSSQRSPSAFVNGHQRDYPTQPPIQTTNISKKPSNEERGERKLSIVNNTLQYVTVSGNDLNSYTTSQPQSRNQNTNKQKKKNSEIEQANVQFVSPIVVDEVSTQIFDFPTTTRSPELPNRDYKFSYHINESYPQTSNNFKGLGISSTTSEPKKYSSKFRNENLNSETTTINGRYITYPPVTTIIPPVFNFKLSETSHNFNSKNSIGNSFNSIHTGLLPPKMDSDYSKVTKRRENVTEYYTAKDITTTPSVTPKNPRFSTQYSTLKPFLTAPPSTAPTPPISQNIVRMLDTLRSLDKNNTEIDTEKYFGQIRPGLKVPPSASPDTLHSLAVYFASALNDMINATKRYSKPKAVNKPEKKDTFNLESSQGKKSSKSIKNSPTSPEKHLLTKTTIDKYDNLFRGEASGLTFNPGLEENNLKKKIDRELKDNNLDLTNQDYLSANQSSIRKLARVFTHALSEYLRDPDTFRAVLAKIRPTEPPNYETTDYSSITKEDEEVLDFSDVIKTTIRPKQKEFFYTTTDNPTTIQNRFNPSKSYFPDNYEEKKKTTQNPYGAGVKPKDSKPLNVKNYKPNLNLIEINTLSPSKNDTPIPKYKNISHATSDLLNYFIPEELNNLASIKVNEDLPPYKFINEENEENLQRSQSQSFVNNNYNRINKNLKSSRYVSSTKSPKNKPNYSTTSIPITTTSDYTVSTLNDFTTDVGITTNNFYDTTTKNFDYTTKSNPTTYKYLAFTNADAITKNYDDAIRNIDSSKLPKSARKIANRGKNRYSGQNYETTTGNNEQITKQFYESTTKNADFSTVRNFEGSTRKYETTKSTDRTTIPILNLRNSVSIIPNIEKTTKTNLPKSSLPNSHWTNSPAVQKLLQTTVTLNPHEINHEFSSPLPKSKHLKNNSTQKDEIINLAESNKPFNDNRSSKKINHPDPSFTLVSDYLDKIPKEVQVKSAKMIFGDLNSTSQHKLMETMKHADSNKSVKKLILLLINACEDASHNETLERARTAIVNALLSQPITDNDNKPEVHVYDKYSGRSRKLDSDIIKPTTYSPSTTKQISSTTPLQITSSTSGQLSRKRKSQNDEILTPAETSDARAIELLKSLYGLAHKWGRK